MYDVYMLDIKSLFNFEQVIIFRYCFGMIPKCGYKEHYDMIKIRPNISSLI